MTSLGASKPFDSVKSYRFENIKATGTEVENISAPSGENLNLSTASGAIIIFNSNTKVSASGDLTVIGNIYIQDKTDLNYIKRLYNDSNNLIWGSDTVVTDATLGSELQSITNASFNNIFISGHINGSNSSSGLKVGGKINLNNVAYTFPGTVGTNGYVLTTDGNGSLNWTNVNAIPTLDTVADVTLTNITNNEILVYNSTNSIWVNTNTPIFVSLGVSNDFDVSGTTTLSSLNVSGATGIDGNFDVNTNKFTVAASSGNTVVGGTLDVSGNTALGGTLALNGLTYTFPASQTANYYLKTNGSGTLSWDLTDIGDLGDVTITSATTNEVLTYNGSAWVNSDTLTLGNTNVWGTLNITGATGIDGNFDIATNKFTVAASSGNTVVGGTLDVSGNTTLGGTLALNGLTYTFPASQTADYYLKTNGSGTLTWAAATAVSAINDLSDVTITSATANEVLTYNGSAWVNSDTLTLGNTNVWGTLNITGATGIDGNFDIATNKFTVAASSGNTVVGGTLTLNGLTYTFPASQTADYYLKTNGSGTLTWAEATAVSAINDLSDVTVTSATTNEVLTYNGSAWVNSDTLTLGNTNVWGTLSITGATGIDGNFDIATNKFTVAASSGNTVVGGTLDVSGNTTLGGTLALNGLTYTFPASQTADYYLKTNGSGTLTWASVAGGASAINDLSDVTITSATANEVLTYNGSAWVNSNTLTLGNTNVWGTLNITGATGIDGNFDIATNKFTVAASSGNTVVGGTLDVSGNTTLGGTLALNGLTYTFPASQTADYYLKTNGSGTLTWASVVTAINNLSDVTITSVTTNEVLTYNGSAWVNSDTLTLGNTNVWGTLNITGATGIDGNFDIATNKFTVAASSGNTVVGGTLDVSGNTTLGGTLTLNGLTYTFPASQTADYYLKTNGSGTLTWASVAGGASAINDLSDVTITSATANEVLTYNGSAWVNSDTLTLGNTNVWGTLNITGATGIDGNFDIATNKFTVAASSGNTVVGGTLDVSGNTTLTGNLTVSGNTICKGAFTTSGTVTINTTSPLIINNYRIYTFTQSTTDATTTTVITFATSSDVKYMVECAISAVETTNAMGFKVTSFFHNDAGTLSQVGTTDTMAFGAQSWSVTTTTSTTNILIRITGANATNIDWKGDVKFIVL